MKYRCMEDCAEEYPIRMMARLLEVSPSGYYTWRKHRQSVRTQDNQRLTRMIREIHQESDGTYGSPRMQKELRGRGQPISRNRVARLMRAARVRGSIKKRYRVPSGRRGVGAVAANVLDRQFTPKAPNEAWAGRYHLYPNR
jgi:putative transposase